MQTDHKKHFLAYVTLEFLRLWLGKVELMAGRPPYLSLSQNHRKKKHFAEFANSFGSVSFFKINENTWPLLEH